MSTPTELPKRRRGQRGFTLVEVMVSILLTVIAVIGIVALYMVQARAGDYSRRTNEASVLAEDQLEILRTLPPASIVSPTTETFLNVEGHPVGSVAAGGLFTRTYTFVPDHTWYDYSVNVMWADDGVNKSVTLYGRRN